MNPWDVFRALTDENSGRSELVSALEAASGRLAAQLGLMPGDSAHYLVGTGYDFSHFSQKLAIALTETVDGVACIWSEACNVPDLEGDRVFVSRQEFVEPASLDLAHTLLVCSSVVADKMEPLTHLIRICPAVRPNNIIIAAALMNSSVRAELQQFLQDYFGKNVRVVCDAETPHDLRQARSRVAERLDSRDVKVVPIMSEWLLSRRFGPRPTPAPRFVR